MTLFAAVVSGGGGGFLGAIAAQACVTLAHLAGLSDQTLQGRWGPPFFDIALFTGVFYAAIATALSRRWTEALLGFLGPFLGIAVPMAVLGRTVQWGWGLELPAGAAFTENPWYRAVVAVYMLAIWGTLLALGRRITGRWLGAGAAMMGAFLAYALLGALTRLVPALTQWPWRASGFLPQPTALLDGLLTGSFLGIAIILTRRTHEKVSDA